MALPLSPRFPRPRGLRCGRFLRPRWSRRVWRRGRRQVRSIRALSRGTGTGGRLGCRLAQGAEVNVGQRSVHHAEPTGKDVGPELDCGQAVQKVAQVKRHDRAEPAQENELGTPFADSAVDLLELGPIGGEGANLVAGEEATDEEGQRGAEGRAEGDWATLRPSRSSRRVTECFDAGTVVALKLFPSG